MKPIRTNPLRAQMLELAFGVALVLTTLFIAVGGEIVHEPAHVSAGFEEQTALISGSRG